MCSKHTDEEDHTDDGEIIHKDMAGNEEIEQSQED